MCSVVQCSVPLNNLRPPSEFRFLRGLWKESSTRGLTSPISPPFREMLVCGRIQDPRSPTAETLLGYSGRCCPLVWEAAGSTFRQDRIQPGGDGGCCRLSQNSLVVSAQQSKYRAESQERWALLSLSMKTSQSDPLLARVTSPQIHILSPWLAQLQTRNQTEPGIC